MIIGLDVGSTTVKAVVVEESTSRILWRDYQRHETRQPETVLSFLERIEAEVGRPPEAFRIFMTGSGGAGICPHLGAKFVQEVTAVSLAVEKLHPETNSVVELGGQDAKIIIFKETPGSDRKKKIPSMNDKCAGGTGAVIDKINAKLQIPAEELCRQAYNGVKLHHVAGKCGVFAETDINGLQKQGVPREELMASLFESIVQQNLAVLTRGHTLRPVVLLLGGPNTFIQGMAEAWRYNIPLVWKERDIPVPDRPLEELIAVPADAQYFAAIGAAEFGRQEDPSAGAYTGTGGLKQYIEVGRAQEKARRASRGLSKTPEELQDFLQRYRREPWEPAQFRPGERVRGFIGLDGGSTSTKAVLLDPNKELLAKAYQLSKGNPIEDTIEIFRRLRRTVESQGATLEVLGVGTTGYAKDVLKDALHGDVALVETVAHTKSALHYYRDVDVICDVGGQDIKIIVLHEGQVKDFKLNTQCSAGNGYFLQSTAESFGFPVETFAEIAFGAQAMPEFGYGCAVFMQSDIVDFQRQGWKPEEIMAGLANVLPKNIWLYVSQIPNLSKLGRNFVLQGGTQHNLAAVKAQVDFIEGRFHDKGEEVRVFVHRHTGESGAIGAALEAVRLYENGHRTGFLGLDAVEAIEYETTRDERTRCYFCKNKCLRTFIDVKTTLGPVQEGPFPYKQGPEDVHAVRIRSRDQADVNLEAIEASAAAQKAIDREAAEAQAKPSKATGVPKGKSRLPLPEGTHRIIIATCEKGTVEDVDEMRQIKKGLDSIKAANPNLVEIAAMAAFQSYAPEPVSDPEPRFKLGRGVKERLEARARRAELRIGMPRALNMYSLGPLFSAWFESLGVPAANLVWSDYTTEQLYREGAKRGSIDPCFPSKLGIPHVHNLLYEHHRKKPLSHIFFPMVDDLPSDLKGCQAHRACPTVTTTPEAVKAAFTKEKDLFAELGVVYVDPLVNPGEPLLFERQMYNTFASILGLSVKENERAVRAGYRALDNFINEIQRGTAREILDRLEAENRLGIVLLGRPYHNDPGINHEILVEFQKLGYPILTQISLPLDDDILGRLFGPDLEEGIISHPLEIQDARGSPPADSFLAPPVWRRSFAPRAGRSARSSCEPARTFVSTMAPGSGKRQRVSGHGGGARVTAPMDQKIMMHQFITPPRSGRSIRARSRTAEVSALQFLPARISMKSLREAARGCQGCPLFRNATQTVFGEGRRSARVFLIGEQPGNDEDLEGLPFVGPAGRVLDAGLESAGIDRADAYVTNVVKHFKWTPKGKRRMHKKPSAREIAACLPWLEKEIELIRPKVLVCLGATAAQALLGRDFKVTAQRGRPVPSRFAEHTIATVHPSSILRQRTSEDRHREMDRFAADLRVVAGLLDGRKRA